uniref:Uncharacterized protein n=1 Tax=Arundo donax TaxID=35708 RepID=A0A0A9HVW4_ARUDO
MAARRSPSPSLTSSPPSAYAPRLTSSSNPTRTTTLSPSPHSRNS